MKTVLGQWRRFSWGHDEDLRPRTAQPAEHTAGGSVPVTEGAPRSSWFARVCTSPSPCPQTPLPALFLVKLGAAHTSFTRVLPTGLRGGGSAQRRSIIPGPTSLRRCWTPRTAHSPCWALPVLPLPRIPFYLGAGFVQVKSLLVLMEFSPGAGSTLSSQACKSPLPPRGPPPSQRHLGMMSGRSQKSLGRSSKFVYRTVIFRWH